MKSIESWQLLMVPTISTPEGCMRVAENDGKPVPLEPRTRAVPAAPHAPAEAPATGGLVARLRERLVGALGH